MSAIYDNWERLVAAVIKKQQIWELCHQQSRSPSVSSESSSSFSFNLNSPSSSSLEESPPFISLTCPEIVGKDRIPLISSAQPQRSRRRRNLTIEVPPNSFTNGFDLLGNGTADDCLLLRPPSPLSISRVQIASSTPRHWPDDAKRQSYPLPLPPSFARGISPANKRWKKGKLIGMGKFGKIYVGFCSKTGELCAIKEVELLGNEAEITAKTMEKEIELLSRLRHPNILCYYGSETIGNSFYMYTEYVAGGSIASVIAEYGKLGESVVRNYAQQILSALSYLHSKNITHGEIKGANVLVDPNGLVKLGNFGVEKNIARKSSQLFHLENPYWMAPEAIMDPNLRKRSAVDVWGLGCTIVEMATSESPWSQYKEGLAIFKIVNKEFPTIPAHFSDECKDFLGHCLQWNPQRRATAFQLLDHPFVKVYSYQKTSNEIAPRRLAYNSPASPTSIIQASDLYTPRKTSSPGSPVLSPLPRPFLPNISSSSNNNLAYWDPKILLGGNTQLNYGESKESKHGNNNNCDDEHLHQFKGATASNKKVYDQLILARRVSQKLSAKLPHV